MNETHQDYSVVGEGAASTDAQRVGTDYGVFGEHVAAVLKAADAAAKRLAAEAEVRAEETLADARNVRALADAYSEQKQREADAHAAKTIEAADMIAMRRVQEASERNAALHKDLELTETRLRDVVAGLHTLASELEELLVTDGETDVDGASSLNEETSANRALQGE